MAIILEPKSNGVSTESNPNYENHTQGGLPLGQLPQGNDEFDAALKKLENTFNVLIDRLNALEGSLKVLQETNKKLESTVALLDPFKQFRENQQSSVATSLKEPLVLTPDMEVKDGHK